MKANELAKEVSHLQGNTIYAGDRGSYFLVSRGGGRLTTWVYVLRPEPVRSASTSPVIKMHDLRLGVEMGGYCAACHSLTKPEEQVTYHEASARPKEGTVTVTCILWWVDD